MARASYDHGLVIERATGGEVTLHDVCGPLPGLPPVAPVKTAAGAVVPQSSHGRKSARLRSVPTPTVAKRAPTPAPTPRKRGGRSQSSTPSVGA